MGNVRRLTGADEVAPFGMKLNIPAASLPVACLWVIVQADLPVCPSRETPRLQGAALNSFVEGAVKSFAEQRLPSKCSVTAGSSRSKAEEEAATWAQAD